MKSLNVLNDEGLDKYKGVTFTEKGYEIVLNYLRNLIQMYHMELTYPLKQGLVLGLPLMKYAQYIPTKEALFERIISYGMILGVNEVDVTHNGSNIKFKIGEKDVE